MVHASGSHPLPTVFEKLNLGTHDAILVLNAPGTFEQTLKGLRNVRVFRRIEEMKSFTFALAFVTQRIELIRLSKALALKAAGDALLWFAYPKGTSKRFTCDFNRDDSGPALRQLGFDGVRQIAIDEDWSAIRFRRVEFIKRGREISRAQPNR